VGVVLYARATLLRLLSISEELGDLQQMINAFTKHLSDLYNLEMFYGDQSLAALLDHAASFNEQMETFEYIYTLTETEKDPDVQTEESEEEPLDDDDDDNETT
tara:strand:+ start:33017 stop:33325 length:309 start_codon:yes stop_codon:yes gene_type:complete